MDESNLKKYAIEYMNFNIRFACWNAEHLEYMFNTNGKGNKELSQRQFALMLVITEFGIDTISGLEEKFHVSKSSLSLTVKKMEELGYVVKKRFPDDADGRVLHIALTENGTMLLDKFRDSIYKSFVAYIGHMSKKNQEIFIKCMEYLKSLDI